MNKRNSGMIFTCGLAVGLAVALCLGAAENSTSPSKPDWSRLKLWGYPNATGIFDPDTGKIYVYDGELRNCFMVRQLGVLGNRLQ